MKCPVDGADLVMSERQGVEIDYCPKCRGVWLDRGELDKIIERAAKELDAAAPPAPAPQAPPPPAPHYGNAPPPYGQPQYGQQPYGQPYRDDHYYKKKRKKSFFEEIFD